MTIMARRFVVHSCAVALLWIGHACGEAMEEGRAGVGEFSGQGAGVTNEPKSSSKVFYVGHSLTNTDVPWIVKGVAESVKLTNSYKQQLNVGAALRAQWEGPAKFNTIPVWNAALGRDEELGANPLTELPLGQYDALVLTEAIPVDKQADSALYFGNYYDLAVKGRKGIDVYLYETWDYVVSDNWAAWRAKLDDWRPVWEKIADDVMAKRPDGPKVHIVPGGQALAALHDAIKSKGKVGTLTDIKQVFHDDIHLNNVGNYYIGLVHFATLYRRDPSGGGPVSAGPFKRQAQVVMDQPTRSALQALAWQVVRAYPRSGVSRVPAGAPEKAKKRSG